MRTEKLQVALPDLPDNTPEYLSRPVPPNTFPLHMLCAAIGGRGTGKTTFMLRLINLYDKYKSFDRIVVFSTTADKDPKMKAFVEGKKSFAEITAHHGYSDQLLQEEMERMEADLETWRQYKAKLELWKRYQAAGEDLDKLSYEDILMLDAMDWQKPKPPNKSGMYPCHAIIFDDLVGERVFKPNMTGVACKLATCHRHLSCSCYFLSQVFINFIPKQLRANNIGLWILFGCKSDKIMEDIAEDVAAKINPQQFVEAWRFATAKPFTPFLCDYDTHDPKRRFRQGIDTALIFEEGPDGKEEVEAVPLPKK